MLSCLLRPSAGLVVLLCLLTVSHSLRLGTERTGDGQELLPSESAKRNGRRMTRDRFRVGYMFGKRSGLTRDSGVLIKTLIGKAIPVNQLTLALHSDLALARHVARHLDRNGDGFVSVSELL